MSRRIKTDLRVYYGTPNDTDVVRAPTSYII